jgi:hypothetical protein
MFHRKFKPGDLVIFRKAKHSNSPGPRAKDISPAPKGEEYTYRVDKFWVVIEVRDDGKLVLQTRRGKVHEVDASHPQLRHAGWLSRILHRGRFPKPGEVCPST